MVQFYIFSHKVLKLLSPCCQSDLAYIELKICFLCNCYCYLNSSSTNGIAREMHAALGDMLGSDTSSSQNFYNIIMFIYDTMTNFKYNVMNKTMFKYLLSSKPCSNIFDHIIKSIAQGVATHTVWEEIHWGVII